MTDTLTFNGDHPQEPPSAGQKSEEQKTENRLPSTKSEYPLESTSTSKLEVKHTPSTARIDGINTENEPALSRSLHLSESKSTFEGQNIPSQRHVAQNNTEIRVKQTFEGQKTTPPSDSVEQKTTPPSDSAEQNDFKNSNTEIISQGTESQSQVDLRDIQSMDTIQSSAKLKHNIESITQRETNRYPPRHPPRKGNGDFRDIQSRNTIHSSPKLKHNIESIVQHETDRYLPRHPPRKGNADRFQPTDRLRESHRRQETARYPPRHPPRKGNDERFQPTGRSHEGRERQDRSNHLYPDRFSRRHRSRDKLDHVRYPDRSWKSGRSEPHPSSNQHTRNKAEDHVRYPDRSWKSGRSKPHPSSIQHTRNGERVDHSSNDFQRRRGPIEPRREADTWKTEPNHGLRTPSHSNTRDHEYHNGGWQNNEAMATRNPHQQIRNRWEDTNTQTHPSNEHNRDWNRDRNQDHSIRFEQNPRNNDRPRHGSRDRGPYQHRRNNPDMRRPGHDSHHESLGSGWNQMENSWHGKSPLVDVTEGSPDRGQDRQQMHTSKKWETSSWRSRKEQSWGSRNEHEHHPRGQSRWERNVGADRNVNTGQDTNQQRETTGIVELCLSSGSNYESIKGALIMKRGFQ